jgi:hypothetical protein
MGTKTNSLPRGMFEAARSVIGDVTERHNFLLPTERDRLIVSVHCEESTDPGKEFADFGFCRSTC